MRARTIPITFALLTSIIAVCWAPPARATIVEELTVAEMAQRSGAVVYGTVTGVESSWDDSHTRIYTEIDIDVIEYVSGSGPEQVSIRQAGGRVGDDELVIAGQPTFTEGEQVVVFLEPLETTGTTRWVVLCLAAGKYRVTTDELTGELVISRDLEGITFARLTNSRRREAPRVARPSLLIDLIREVRRATTRGGVR